MKKRSYIEKMVQKFLRDADHRAEGNLKGLGSMFLTGDPGIGKTSFVNLISDLTGVSLITIEVPHVVEEHIINIPFLVYNPQNNQHESGHTELHDKDTKGDGHYDMVLADSHLFSKLKNGKKIADAEYLKKMTEKTSSNSRMATAQDIFKKLGGNETTIPPRIKKIRDHYKSILFFDEYLRQAPIRIRNILRDTLNGNLGLHKIPKGTFMIYASNVHDDGVEDVPKNTQMSQMTHFRTPFSHEWFDWIKVKFKNDKHVKLKKEVIEAFESVIDDDTLSHNDFASDVRTSPRRWEQLVIYVNQSIPVADEKEANALLTNVKNNFLNYETKEYSALGDKVVVAVKKLIGHKDNNKKVPENEEWIDNLDHHLQQHMKSGQHRKYIPVVSGPPGVGKTSRMHALAQKHNLILVAIDSSRLTSDHLTGLPVPGKQDKDKKEIEVKFSLPQLHEEITREIKAASKDFFKSYSDEHGSADAEKEFEKWEKQDWKFLLFFDELNRVDTKTFNSLRRVILEKNFGPAGDSKGGVLKLPEGSVVVGAINPDADTGGTTSMTSHFRDVVDIIEANPSWKHTREFLKNSEKKNISEEVKKITLDLLDGFVKKFGDKELKEQQRAFHIVAEGDESMYISPREYESFFINMAAALEDIRQEVINSDEESSEAEIMSATADELRDAAHSSLSMPALKAEADNDHVVEMISEWFAKQSKDVFSELIVKEVKHGKNWSSSLTPYLTGEKDVTDMTEDSNINTMTDNTNLGEFIEDISQAIAKHLKDKKSIQKLLLDENSSKVKLGDDQIEDTDDETNAIGRFAMGLLFTLHLHDYQYDRLSGVGKTLSKGLSGAIKNVKDLSEDEMDDAIHAALTVRTDINEALREIKNDDDK